MFSLVCYYLSHRIAAETFSRVVMQRQNVAYVLAVYSVVDHHVPLII